MFSQKLLFFLEKKKTDDDNILKQKILALQKACALFSAQWVFNAPNWSTFTASTQGNITEWGDGKICKECFFQVFILAKRKIYPPVIQKQFQSRKYKVFFIKSNHDKTEVLNLKNLQVSLLLIVLIIFHISSPMWAWLLPDDAFLCYTPALHHPRLLLPAPGWSLHLCLVPSLLQFVLQPRPIFPDVFACLRCYANALDVDWSRFVQLPTGIWYSNNYWDYKQLFKTDSVWNQF